MSKFDHPEDDEKKAQPAPHPGVDDKQAKSEDDEQKKKEEKEKIDKDLKNRSDSIFGSNAIISTGGHSRELIYHSRLSAERKRESISEDGVHNGGLNPNVLALWGNFSSDAFRFLRRVNSSSNRAEGEERREYSGRDNPTNKPGS